MKFITTIATIALAFAGSASAATCTPGVDYCSKTLQDIDSNNEGAIKSALTIDGEPILANIPAVWHQYIFHCNSDKSLTLAGGCAGGCEITGQGKNDICHKYKEGEED
ncbi:hypothetical protein P170DRAFT_477330 [Aspergillus steynii IBT 23096]|uniref:Uncharacterized protein n=1 Tax=Aspergillus steynii IBT 23096 TaxID=1392250 RepID=A0A2I2G0P5_9EURO|nr:uncharacterized protein P170DRAFT_477330 [Aspergillus steynii IBT 23096]PLB46449.1 hypothetical protein P170DRAFT_477330 [Aspergillus steynii IBT 23096]